MPIAKEIDRILSEPKWSQERIAAELGVSQSTIYRWLRGSEPDEPNREKALALYASIFDNVDATRVPLVGTVGSGQEISPLRGGEDFVDGPPQTRSNTVAVRIKGDWMLPSFDDGWLLYYSQQMPPGEMLHHRCIVKLSDQRMLVKTIRRGSKDGVWTLASYGEPDIRDVRIEWVAPIDWIQPKRPPRSTFWS